MPLAGTEIMILHWTFDVVAFHGSTIAPWIFAYNIGGRYEQRIFTNY